MTETYIHILNYLSAELHKSALAARRDVSQALSLLFVPLFFLQLNVREVGVIDQVILLRAADLYGSGTVLSLFDCSLRTHEIERHMIYVMND